jgi:molecular chaperone HtpG
VHGADSLGEISEELKTASEEHKLLFEHLAERFGANVSEVRLTARLTDSPGVLVSESGGPRPHMQRMMKEVHGQDMPNARILEINADHPLIEQMLEMHKSDGVSERLDDFGDLLYGQVLLAEGSILPDAARFSSLVSDLMISVGKAK